MSSITFNYPQRIGLIAGEGNYPLILAKEASRRGCEVITIAFNEFTSPEISAIIPDTHWFPFGQFQPVLETLVNAQIKEAIFAGKIPHTVVFNSDMLENRIQSVLKGLPTRQTDNIIGAAADAFGIFGIKFLDARTFMEDHLAHSGPMTKRVPSVEETLDIEFGQRIAKHIGEEDIGQTVVIKKLVVLAVEAIEGTDQAIQRGAQYGGKGIVIVKVSKPNQDFRFDIPVIGLDTLQLMHTVQAGVLAVESEKTLILNKDQFVAQADKLNLCIFGLPVAS